MVILLTGATGFIGRPLSEALVAAGHDVMCAVRGADTSNSLHSCYRHVHADFGRDFEAEAWLPRLAGVDAVINAVGILRESKSQSFEAIHVNAPRALFSASDTAGVRLVIQISALGADEHAKSRYHLSKKTADDFLRSLAVPSVVVQPSLVYGPGGTSARLFTTLASLPLIPLPGRGEQGVQPIHIDDLVEAIVKLVETNTFRGERIPLVGPQPLTLREFLARLRHAMGSGRAYFLPVPAAVVRASAKIAAAIPGSLLDSETLAMLERGNTADPSATRTLLGREPRQIEDFVNPHARTLGKLEWLLSLMRFGIALVWIVTGILSLGVYPVAESYALLARVGIEGVLAPLFLYGAALIDIAFGIAILAMKKRRLLWLAQIAVIVFYTAIITWKLPEFWLHPYGPILKNIPMLIAIWMLYELEER